MEQVLSITGLLFVLTCTFGKVEGVSCKACHQVDKPDNCRVSIPCGAGEMCSTERFSDVNGLQAYRLGCDNAERCRLIVDAKSLLGKRQISPKCYECCETEDCNVNLCRSSVGHVHNGDPVTTLSPSSGQHTCPPQVIQSNNSLGCPQMYVPFKDKCYLVGPGSKKWVTAKTFCRQHGGNMVSVNSKEEHDFLKGLVNNVNATFIHGYWTGGFYSHEAGEYEYVDGSPFSYTDWHNGNPPTSYSKDTMYYVWLGNPAFSHNIYKDLPMATNFYSASARYGIICETNN